MTTTKKATPTDPDLAPSKVSKPPATGPTVEPAQTAKPAAILAGHEDEPELTLVHLTGGGPGDGDYRVSAEVPHVVISNNARYVLSDRAARLYSWEAK
jgi:hypothetical protein